MSVQQVCQDLELSTVQCRKLEDFVGEYCRGRKPKRRRSKWQECIAVRRKGKPFDPQAMKKLSIEYKAGKCP